MPWALRSGPPAPGCYSYAVIGEVLAFLPSRRASPGGTGLIRTMAYVARRVGSHNSCYVSSATLKKHMPRPLRWPGHSNKSGLCWRRSIFLWGGCHGWHGLIKDLVVTLCLFLAFEPFFPCPILVGDTHSFTFVVFPLQKTFG